MLLLSLILLGISLFSPFGHLKAISIPKDLSISKPDIHRRSLNGIITEWTAMGDSYAAGIGAGSVIKPVAFYDICYRSDQSYPSDMQSGPTAFSPQPQTFNYLACSGATLPQILMTQLNDAPSGVYPAWGKAPEFATITMGTSSSRFPLNSSRVITPQDVLSDSILPTVHLALISLLHLTKTDLDFTQEATTSA